MDRETYEFLKGTSEGNVPIWSKDSAERGAILAHKNQCRRASISYNKGIGRYLLWQQYTMPWNPYGNTDSDTRFHGGMGVYEAPEPWGPWRTVYFSEKWDIGPGDLGCFPTKWMSEDGKTVYLVFSGDDNFCVRKAILTIEV